MLFCPQIGDFFPGFFEKPLTFGFRFILCPAQERSTLLVELLVLLLELFFLFLRFCLFRIGICKFSCDPLLTRIDGVENRFVKEALQQPHQYEEVKHLGNDSEPIDQHRRCSSAAQTVAVFQNGLAKIKIIETTKQ